jgi:hypothetical protein
MYTNRRHARTRVLDDSVIRDTMTKTRDLRVSILCVGTSPLCVSHVVEVAQACGGSQYGVWPSRVWTFC